MKKKTPKVQVFVLIAHISPLLKFIKKKKKSFNCPRTALVIIFMSTLISIIAWPFIFSCRILIRHTFGSVAALERLKSLLGVGIRITKSRLVFCSGGKKTFRRASRASVKTHNVRSAHAGVNSMRHVLFLVVHNIPSRGCLSRSDIS